MALRIFISNCECNSLVERADSITQRDAVGRKISGEFPSKMDNVRGFRERTIKQREDER